MIRCDLNESHLPPPPSVVAAIAAASETVHRYPEFGADTTRRAIAAHIGLEPTQVSVGPGATAVVHAILADAVQRARMRGISSPEILTPAPTFDGFALLAGMIGVGLHTTPLHADGRPDPEALSTAIGPDTAAVIVCSPHNPTGRTVDAEALSDLFARIPPSTRVVLDQAYVEYCSSPPDVLDLISRFPGLVVVRTFSKAYGLAGLRAGYAFGGRETMAGILSRELPFAVSTTAAVAVSAVLAADAEIRDRVRTVRAERTRVAARLEQLGYPTPAGEANFIYVPGPDGLALDHLLTRSGIQGKVCGTHGFRLTVGDPTAGDAIEAALRRSVA
ncbi:histidinol-phosphate transaminase [Gordonia sp. L191]|uniref:pyridoxal phosphate-dependent aminotransferase n=1 Tax=Gordonia sp. L191 TaxID=2982699 RepID=UPI0024C0992B|nr:histidinol-phosphate transaminase [Gordonia sp. L191]WHU49540.1 histidinol-phosphate transaminase [Gordonia sp. L191]